MDSLYELKNIGDVGKWLEQQDENVILDRLMSTLPDELDKSEGSYLFDAVSPDTYEFAIAYMALKHVLEIAFAEESYDDYLDKKAKEHGVYRKSAVKASGILSVTGEPYRLIKVGSKFSNTLLNESTQLKIYVTTEDTVLDSEGKAILKIEAETAGVIGNAQAGEINNNFSGIAGIYSVTNNEPLLNGVDKESDEDLLKRLFERVQNPPSSGNKSDYVRWAKEVNGVGEVIVIPLWDGPGTVKIIVLDSEGQPVSQDVITSVKNYLDPANGTAEGKAPIGANVTVVTATVKSIDVEIPSLEIESGYNINDVMERVKTNLSKYFKSVSPGGIIRIKDAESNINCTEGVSDFGNIKLNNQGINIILGKEEKADIGVVSFV